MQAETLEEHQDAPYSDPETLIWRQVRNMRMFMKRQH